MNDFERKLSRVPFRTPPEDLRAVVLARADSGKTAGVNVRWTWRDWLWPAPQAWVALAALWILFAVLSFASRPPETTLPPAEAAQPVAGDKLFSLHSNLAWNHDLDLTN
jgi:hypothetical protein